MAQELVSIDGELFTPGDAKISVFDHCFLYGDGVFEGIRIVGGKILLHKEHMRRLYQSAAVTRLSMPDEAEYERRLFRVVKESGLQEGYVRVVVSRGLGTLGIDPRRCPKSMMVIMASLLTVFPPELVEKGLNLIVARTHKIPAASFDCRTKSCNYLNNIMATWEFIDRGAHEAIVTDADGIVSEGTVDNIFGIRGDEVITPSLDTNCLEGTTRKKVIEIAREVGMKLTEGRFTVRDFSFADEVFLTGTGAGIVPVSTIEQYLIGKGGMGPKTRKLREIYESRLSEYSTAVH